MKSIEHPGWPRIAAIAAIAVLPIAVIGCSGDESALPPSTRPAAPAQSSASASASAPGQQAAITSAYNNFWFRLSHADEKPEDTWHDALAAVAVDPQLSDTLKAMHQQKQTGVTVYGDVTARISSIVVHGDTAKLVDCQDASRSGQADVRSGDHKTVGVSRNPVNASLQRDRSDDQWKVARIAFPGGTC